MKRKTTHFKVFILIVSLLFGINLFAQQGAGPFQSAPGITTNHVDPMVSNHRPSTWQSEAEILQFFEAPPQTATTSSQPGMAFPNQLSPEQEAAYIAHKEASGGLQPEGPAGNMLPGILPTNIQSNLATDAVWDILFHFEAISGMFQFDAVETDGTFIYCGSYGYPGLIYKYTTGGTAVSTFTLSGWPAGVNGIWSMTNDGTFMYAVGYTNLIIKINMATQAVVGTITPSPVIGALTFIGYDPTLNAGAGGFWTGSTNSIFQVTMAGAQIQQIPAATLSTYISGITGCVYDPYSTPGNGNQKLWFFAQDGTNHVTLHQFNPAPAVMAFTGVTHDAIDVPGMIPGANNPFSLAGSCTGSSTLIPGKFVLIGIAENSLTGTTHSPVWGYELANTYSFNGDVGITALVAPVTSMTNTATEAVTVTIHNYGTVAQTNFPLYFTFQGGAPQMGTYTGTAIAGGANANYTFPQTVNMTVYGNYSFNACTAMPLDQNTGNDCKSFTVTHNIPTMTDTLYPNNLPYWTGTTNGSTFTETSWIRYMGVSGGVGYVGWAKFNVAPLASAAIINSVTLRAYFTASVPGGYYWPYIYIQHLTIDPMVSTAAAVFNSATTNTSYYTYNGPSGAVESYVNFAMPAATVTDLLTAIPSGWFAFAFYEYEMTNSYYGGAMGWQQANRPQLIVNHSNPIPHDVGVTTMNLDPYAQMYQYQAKCTIHNFGTNAETNVPVHIHGPGNYDTTVIVQSLAVGQTLLVIFQPHNFPAGSNQCFTACTQMASDMVMFNDCQSGCMQFDAYLTTAYGYIAAGTAMTVGPCKFSTQHPNAITSLAATTTQLVTGGAWAHNNWYVNEIVSGTSVHGHLYRVNTNTGVMTDIGPLGGMTIQGLAFDHTQNIMYGIGTTAAATAGTYIVKLYTINLTTGAATFVHNFASQMGAVISLACNNAGMLFANDIISQSIWAIDPLTYSIEKVGPTNLVMNYVQSASFDKVHDIYYHAGWLNAGSGNLYSCNTANAVMTYINQFQGNSEVTGFAIPFSYETTPTCDIGVMWISYPQSGNPGTAEPVQVKIRNYGNAPVSNFNVCYKFMNQAPICENWQDMMGMTLSPGDAIDYAFITYAPTGAYGVNCGAPGDYPIKAWISELPAPFNVPDVNRINDTVNKTVHNGSCTPILCFTGSIQETEACGDDINGGCNSTPNAFVDILNNQTYCGTTWKIDTLRDTDWYRFVLTSTKVVAITAKSEMNCDFLIVKLPCSLDSVITYKTFTKCVLDSLISGNLVAGTYALIVAHNWSDYTTTCQNNDKYTFTLQIRPGKPCIPSGVVHGSLDEYIANITITPGTINNSSDYSPNGYGDYTYLCTDMTIGQSYQINMNNGCYSAYWSLDYNGCWVDWNQNLSFSDVGEKVTMSPSPGNPSSGTIIPPANALPGPTILRARIEYATDPIDPCLQYSYSEAEDYCVIVHSPIPPVNTTVPTYVSGACPGQKVIPINVQNCVNVNGITLTLNTSTWPSGGTVTYLGYQNVNPQLTGTISVTSSTNQIVINWFNATTAANITNGKLLDLVINVPSDTTYLNWVTAGGNCVYTSTASGAISGCTYVNGKMYYGHCQNVSGRIRYKHFDQVLGVPVLHPYFFKDSVQAILMQGTTVMYSFTTVADSGKYTIPNVNLGTYTLTATSDNGPNHKWKRWGGGNATDALYILRNFVGIAPLLSGLQYTAADVNGTGGIPNAADALAVSRRFVGAIPNFQPPTTTPGGPDWYWDKYTINVTGTANITQNLFGLCAGDVNGSYTPLNTSLSPVKANPTVFMKTEGSVVFDKSIINVPVYAENALTIGAASLVMNYPENLEITGVNITSSPENLVYTATNGTIRIAWFNLDPLQLKAGDIFLTLKVRAKSLDGKDMTFTVTDESTFANENAIDIDNASLFMPKLVSTINADDYSLTNFPNPFNSTTEIRYTMPKDGHVSLKVFNVLGEEVATLVNTDQASGVHTVSFNGANLKRGVYVYKLEVNDVTKVNSMIISE